MEKAKKLFEKRVGANTSDGHDDITDDEEYMEEIIKSKKGICSVLTRVNSPSKGQLISKCLFGVFVWTKKPTEFFPGFFLPLPLKRG